MTEKQFKKIMDKLEEIRRATEAAGREYYPAPLPCHPDQTDQPMWKPAWPSRPILTD